MHGKALLKSRLEYCPRMDNPARNLLKRLYMVTKDAEFLEKWAELDVDNLGNHKWPTT